ncbi:MAG: Asp-tRNA(Asn)/Glu-tRNA(Gln) amidotransferase subunit GatA [candidate division WOR-3 bacterium]
MWKIYEIVEGYKNKRFSAKEVFEEIGKRIKENEHLNAFITLNESDIPENALPIAVKDNIITKGIRTTAGSRILENYIPPYNSTVVKRLLDKGFYIVGKTNLDEFAMGSTGENSAFGPTLNPYNNELVPGGSSSGSGAAVGAKMVPVALGSDTGGSIRLPAAYCNIWGFKPSYGRVSRFGLIAFASSLDVIGPMALSPRDITLVMEIISGYDPFDSTSLKIDGVKGERVDELKRKGKWEIGVLENLLDVLDGKISEKFEVFLREIQKFGVEIKGISLNFSEFALASYYIIASSEASSNLARYDGVRYGARIMGNDLWDTYERTRELFGNEVKRRIGIGTFALSYGYYDKYYLKALQARRLIRDELNKALEGVDFLVIPTSPSLPPKIGAGFSPLDYYKLDSLTVPFSLAGLPVMNVPLGDFVGVQVAGRFAGDEGVLAFSEVLEEIIG